jgi:hypothetical protein
MMTTMTQKLHWEEAVYWNKKFKDCLFYSVTTISGMDTPYIRRFLHVLAH